MYFLPEVFHGSLQTPRDGYLLARHLDSAAFVAYQSQTQLRGRTEPLDKGPRSRSQNVFDLLVCVHIAGFVSSELVLVINTWSSGQFLPLKIKE